VRQRVSPEMVADLRLQDRGEVIAMTTAITDTAAGTHRHAPKLSPVGKTEVHTVSYVTATTDTAAWPCGIDGVEDHQECQPDRHTVGDITPTPQPIPVALVDRNFRRSVNRVAIA